MYGDGSRQACEPGRKRSAQDGLCAPRGMSVAVCDSGRRFPDYTIAELHAIATRALANGDEYERGPLRDQLKREEFGEESDIARGAK